MTMQPLTRRTVLSSTAAFAATAALSSCDGSGGDSEAQEKIDNPDDNINAEGMPIVDEKITVTMMTRRSPDTAEDWNEVASMQEMERISNINIVLYRYEETRLSNGSSTCIALT